MDCWMIRKMSFCLALPVYGRWPSSVPWAATIFKRIHDSFDVVFLTMVIDRILVAPAIAEGIMLLTSDSLVAQYPGPIRLN